MAGKTNRMNILSYLKGNRSRINQDLQDIRIRRLFSPAQLCLDKAFTPLVSRYLQGLCLDIGCGDQPYRALIESSGTQYESVDVERRSEDLTYMADIHNMDAIPGERFDCAICLEVLEHVSNPFIAVAQISRLLKTDGLLILSVPHLSRVHEAPHDYFRYTQYGIRSILESNGFEVLEMKPTGALFSFLGHQWSLAINSLFWSVPVIRWAVFGINVVVCVYPSYLIDRLLRKVDLFPLSHVCVARKM